MPKLTAKEINVTMPTYSLTSDLTSFLRCPRQYRMQKRGRLAPINPVQMWSGLFIHGFMESALLLWQNQGRKTPISDYLNQETIPELVNDIFNRLKRQGLLPRGPNVTILALERAFAMIDIFSETLFPYIAHSEIKLQSVRKSKLADFRNLDSYEILGIVDILVGEREPTALSNGVDSILTNLLTNMKPKQEFVVDYKSMIRPATNSELWKYQNWQVNTYSWLRQRDEATSLLPRGAIIYVNDLVPTLDNLKHIIEEIKNENTDIIPPEGSDEEKLILNPNTLIKDYSKKMKEWRVLMAEWMEVYWEEKDWTVPMPRLEPTLPLSDLRRKRAVRIIDTSPIIREGAIDEFDSVASSIELCIQKELDSDSIDKSWIPKKGAHPRDSDCTICSFKTFCPKMKEMELPIPKGPK
jgi:hypothetical protein